MPNGVDNGSDLVAFAKAVGNYSDLVSAPSARVEQPPVEQPQPGTPEPAEPPETPAEEEPTGEVALDQGLPAGTAIVPLLGMRMSPQEVDLGFARLVRFGSLEHRPEDVAGAEHNVFAVIECAPSSQAPRAASECLRQTVIALRLLKPGGVGLGPNGWVRDREGWKIFPTGVARPRAGGYELSREDAEALRELSDQIAERAVRTRVFTSALARFDLAAVRTSHAEALSDYVLALRALLEDGGPARAEIADRAAGICAGAGEREELRAELERAIELEQRLIGGERIGPGTAQDAIATVEEIVRTLLCGMATGELGSDLRITADEILVADQGVSVMQQAGEGSAMTLGGTAEWQIPEPPGVPDMGRDVAEAERIVAERGRLTAKRTTNTPDLLAPGGGLGPPRVEARPSMNESRSTELSEPPDWLSDTLGGDRDRELVWPAFAGPHPRGRPRRRGSSDRVRHLFPVPDETDWSISDYGEQRKPA